jgi:phage baseplate assembly protein W
MAYIKGGLENINLAPETVYDEILQNVAVLLSTPAMTVPLDRGLGLKQEFLDKPVSLAENMLVAEVMDAVELYEPRAVITDIEFERDEMNGRLVPIVEVSIINDY